MNQNLAKQGESDDNYVKIVDRISPSDLSNPAQLRAVSSLASGEE